MARLDAEMHRWPVRWLVAYLCLMSTAALAVSIASMIARTAS